MKTYTAREWLEITLPKCKEWRRFDNFLLAYPDGSDVDGVRFNINGEVDGPCFDAANARDGQTKPISRSTAIDLMVSAIEAGEVDSDEIKPGDEVQIVGPLDKEWENHVEELEAYVGKTGQVKNLYKEYGDTVYVAFGDSDSWNFHRKNVVRCKAGEVSEAPDPYAHLPHGGWWSDNRGMRTLGFYKDEVSGATHYDPATGALMPLGQRHGSAPWKDAYGPRLTRDQAIAIIEAHKASKEPTPAPAFGGPHDAAAVKWAEERGYKVVGWRRPVQGDKYIVNSHDLIHLDEWEVLDFWTSLQGFRYILAPLAQPEPEQKKGDGYHDVNEFYREDEDEAIDDGGLVYPQSYVGNDAPHEGIGGGMTIRQHYAGLAMQGLMASAPWSETPRVADIASISREVADALLAELRKEGEK